MNMLFSLKTQTLQLCAKLLNSVMGFDHDFTYWYSPADLRAARIHDNPVVLLEVETVIGANFSFLIVIKVELEEQIPRSLNWPLAFVRARMTLGWLASATEAAATGTPVTL